MKRGIIRAVVAVAAVGILVLSVACSAKSTTGSGSGKGATVSGMSVGYEFEGKDLKIVLEENPTTGYQWTYVLTSNGQASTGIEAVSDEFKESSNSNQQVGAPGVHEYLFKGVQEGNYQIDFSYSRSWEPSESDETCSFEVKLAADGNITNVEQKNA